MSVQTPNQTYKVNAEHIWWFESPYFNSNLILLLQYQWARSIQSRARRVFSRRGMAVKTRFAHKNRSSIVMKHQMVPIAAFSLLVVLSPACIGAFDLCS